MKLRDLIMIGISSGLIAAAATARIEMGAAPWYLVFPSIAASLYLCAMFFGRAMR